MRQTGKSRRRGDEDLVSFRASGDQASRRAGRAAPAGSGVRSVNARSPSESSTRSEIAGCSRATGRTRTAKPIGRCSLRSRRRDFGDVLADARDRRSARHRIGSRRMAACRPRHQVSGARAQTRRSNAGLPRSWSKVRLLGDERSKVGIELERGREGVERLGAIAGQAPVAGQVIVQQGLVGMLAQGAFERVDRLGEPIGPLVAPSQGQGDARIGGPQATRRSPAA